MTDVELKRLQAICEVANVDDIEDVSDGFHTFNDLYEQRMYLFAALVRAYKNKAWKSLRHEDGEYCFGGDWFIVGIDTPKGSYTYHYGIQYWDVFDCQILPRAKHWDGHTDKDVARLMSLEPEVNCSEIPNNWIPCSKRMPEEHEWIGTKRFGTTISDEVYVTFENPKGERLCKHLSFQNGKLSSYDQATIDAFYKGSKPIAWMPLPEPARLESDEE